MLSQEKDRDRCIKNMKHHLRDDGNILIHIGQPKYSDSIWRSVHIAPMNDEGQMHIEECIQDLGNSTIRIIHRFQQYHKDSYQTGTWLISNDLNLLSTPMLCTEMEKHDLILQKQHEIDEFNTIYFFQHRA